ncbi:MAG: translation initiation factor IF-2 [Pseudomonadota bacterium]
MTDQKEQDRKTLSLGGRGKLSLNKTADGAQVRQSFSHGRSKTVQVEVKRKRVMDRGTNTELADGGAAARRAAEGAGGRGQKGSAGRTLTEAEREARARVLRINREEQARQPEPVAEPEPAEAEVAEPEAAPEAAEPVAKAPLSAEELRQRELDELKRIEAEEQQRKEQEAAKAEEIERQRREEEARRQAEEERRRAVGERSGQAAAAKVAGTEEEDDRGRRSAPRNDRRPPPGRGRNEPRRRGGGKMTVTQALNQDGGRSRSLASQRRRQEKQRAIQDDQPKEKIIRDVVIPEVITVQELANRMAERGADVIKTMMRMGVMATINQSIDADTAELVVEEFGHRSSRVSESDVEIGMRGQEDETGDLLTRPPVVTIMGHVDHGKTSLLDAMRKTNVVSGEAGGITQHIGAYQVPLDDGGAITFIDTPGHEAFTSMRARGANTTDIVVLVVAADDAVMPQTVEAIRHAKAADVPIIVAINKVDLPDANPQRVREALLQHEIVVEALGGDVQDVEVSAKTGKGLDDLREAIGLQAEVLELTANPERPAEGSVIEAKLERGRGSVATVLVQRGTLRVGDIFVTGSEWGRVRALIDDHGRQVSEAGPSFPVEVLGLQGTPLAGDDFVVVADEARAREISEYRDRKKREAAQVAGGRGTLEQMFAQAQKGEVKAMPVIIKGDVQGSVEAIGASLTKLVEDNEELEVRVLHSAVGAVNESDTTLAASTGALVIGFNVRANPQAREAAKRDGVEIRYYSVIYDVIDDVRNALSGMLAPTLRENFIGNAEIREVFQITRVGKVAGCMVTDGVVRRGAGVRLLRDNVVIHEGKLKTLKRFKDEVREVREGYECGMAFENYDDIRIGDVIEAYEVEEVERGL